MFARIRPGSVLAALLLAAVTLAVFSTEYNNGPESTIRRFHAAAQRGQPFLLPELVVEDAREPVVGALYVRIVEYLAAGVRYRVLRTVRNGPVALTEVLYASPTGETNTMIWVVKRVDGEWRIDVGETVTVLRRALF